MPRAKGGFKSHRRKKKVLERAKGYYGAQHRAFTVATEVVDKGLLHAYKHRKRKKTEFRALWIARINAASRALGLTYSQLINGLKKANVEMNRKSMADLAFHNPTGFASLAETAKTALATA